MSPRFDLRSLLERVEAAAPVEPVRVWLFLAATLAAAAVASIAPIPEEWRVRVPSALVLAGADDLTLEGSPTRPVVVGVFDGGDHAHRALSAAAGGPLWSRAMDRRGQGAVLRWAMTGYLLCGYGFVAAVTLGAPRWSWFVLAALCGASGPNIGSLVRARWAEDVPAIAAALDRLGGPPRTDEATRRVTVPVDEGMVVLDAVFRVQETAAPDLAVRWNCKAAHCGSCSAEINGRPKLLCKTRVEEFDGAPTIECWLHGSCFDLRTGKVSGPPAKNPVRTHRVVVQDGMVYVQAGTPADGAA